MRKSSLPKSDQSTTPMPETKSPCNQESEFVEHYRKRILKAIKPSDCDKEDLITILKEIDRKYVTNEG